MSILPAFSVVPKKTFLGFDKSSGHCFTVKKALNQSFINHFKLAPGNLQKEVKLVTETGEFSAILRLIIQNKSKPNKTGIKRNWKDRNVLNIGWKGNSETIAIFHDNLPAAINLVRRGLKNNRQSVDFEHLGGNRFYVSFNSTYL
jgi:hypothetical protein